MYAIVQTGGKQYQAQSGEVLIVEKIDGEVGTKFELADVLAVIDGDRTKLGSPYVKGARVRVEIIRQAKAKKINAFNYKAKKNQRWRWGHRQPQTYLRVIEVVAGS